MRCACKTSNSYSIIDDLGIPLSINLYRSGLPVTTSGSCQKQIRPQLGCIRLSCISGRCGIADLTWFYDTTCRQDILRILPGDIAQRTTHRRDVLQQGLQVPPLIRSLLSQYQQPWLRGSAIAH